jgi:hypothetical protein
MGADRRLIAGGALIILCPEKDELYRGFCFRLALFDRVMCVPIYVSHYASQHSCEYEQVFFLVWVVKAPNVS